MCRLGTEIFIRSGCIMLRSRKNAKNRSRLTRFFPQLEMLERREVFSATPYVLPSAAGVETTAILTVNDPVQGAAQNGYRMAGTPDGLGAFDNGDGTFTVLMNHEFSTGEGGPRTH